jgi:hypothetical protein
MINIGITVLHIPSQQENITGADGVFIGVRAMATVPMGDEYQFMKFVPVETRIGEVIGHAQCRQREAVVREHAGRGDPVNAHDRGNIVLINGWIVKVKAAVFSQAGVVLSWSDCADFVKLLLPDGH